LIKIEHTEQVEALEPLQDTAATPQEVAVVDIVAALALQGQVVE
jgi:hypothetical protein|tara:strand:- start:7178 stop:7309 length:132 start_codon:yes stop_codon:yes gene_type:complete